MAANEAENIGKPQKHRLKLLVVDDDELNRRMMRLLLTREGHDVQLADNGLEAFEAIKEQRFDIVFMDLQMPIMDGIEASRRIREWENGGYHTFIVALTASYMPEEGQVLFEAGMDNYVSKPFEVEHIQRLLNLVARTGSSTVHHDPSPAVDDTIDSQILDIQKGIERVGGDLKTYKELLTDFIQGLPERIQTLERLYMEQNWTLLARAAHNLKGVSSNLGALQLSEYASKLDKQSNAGYTDYNQALFLELKRAETELKKTATDFLTNQEKTVA